MQHFPFPAYSGKGTPQLTLKVGDTRGCMTLGHSNWTTYTPQNLFLQNAFKLYQQATCSISLFLHTAKRATYSGPQK